jgi:ABC-2 type transport system permease protein
VSARRVRAVVARIIALFRRDHRTLALIVVVPVAVLLLLGWVIRDQQIPVTKVAIVNEAGESGERLVDALASASVSDADFVVQFSADDEAAGRALVADRRADLLIVLPAGFGSGSATVELVTLGLNPGADGTHIGRFQLALSRAIAAILPAPIAELIPDVERSTIHGRAEADVLDSFAPVFVGYFAYFFVFLLTGVSFLRERIGGTLERLLATPVTRAEIVLGYSLGFGIFATIQVAIVLAFTLMRIEVPALGPLPSFVIGLDVPSAGSPLLSYLIALVLGLGAVSLGIFLSTFARTELQVIQFIPVVIVPQGLLGGIFWPVDTLPDILQPLARLMPVTYAVEGLREVMIGGADLATQTVQVDLIVLVAIAAFFVVLAARTIRREVA